MVVVAHSGIFGGGVFSTAHARRMRMVGSGERQITQIRIQPINGARRTKEGTIKFASVPPYMPKSAADLFHPGANSLCFAIQLAHLMGCSPIHLWGFTLDNGQGYDAFPVNPVTKKKTFYERERALEWLRWYQAAFPGRVFVDPRWASSSVGKVFSVEPCVHEVQASSGSPHADDRGHQPVANDAAADQQAGQPVVDGCAG